MTDFLSSGDILSRAVMGWRLLIVGLWLFVVSHWLLAFGYWLSADPCFTGAEHAGEPRRETG
jgi:hypothetical protein